MAEYEYVVDLLSPTKTAGGVEEKTIQEAERKLGVQFPRSFRLFLAKYGAIAETPYEMTGLSNEEIRDDQTPTWWDVVSSTLRMQRASRGLIPKEYVLIASDGGDFKFYLDTSRSNNQGECPVVVLGPGADDVVVAEDFFDFLIRSFEGRVSF